MVEPEDIELTADDMYADGFIVTFDDGTQILQRPEPIDYIPQKGDNYREFVNGEDLTTIAYDEYNNSKQWWSVADANKVFNPLYISEGTGLIIPQIDNTVNYGT